MRSIAILWGVVVAVSLGIAPASATELTDMIGKWSWTDYKIEVVACDTNPSGAGVCATVAEGPQNVGMEMIRSKISKKGEDFVGEIAHPATGEIYMTRMTFEAPDTWRMDGCTNGGVCAKGDFTRVK